MSDSGKPLILVTGSSGMLGSALIARLAGHYKTVGLDRTIGEADCPEIEADLTSRGSIDVALDTLREDHGSSIAAVIHLAAYYDFTGEQHPLYDELNVNGTRRLLQALQDFDVERFVFASSMLVHRPGEPGIAIDESQPIEPAWAYPQSKAGAEAAIGEHRGTIPCTILRMAGAYSDEGGVPTLTHQIQRIYERRIKGMLFAGDKSRGQANVHIDDAIEAFVKTIERRSKLPPLAAYLIGEPDTPSYEAQQNLIAQCLHDETPTTLRVPGPFAKAAAWLQASSEPIVPDIIDKGEKPFIRPFMVDLASDHYELDIGKAREALDWQPQRRFLDVLPSICAALERDPLKWYEDNSLTAPTWLQQLDEVEPGGTDRLTHEFERSYRQAHASNRWAPFMNLALATWLMTSPVTLGYTETFMTVSDVATGALLAILALLSLSWRAGFVRWIQTGVGMYLLGAPLLFWTTHPSAYLNDTLVGAFVIGLAIALRPVPGVAPAAELAGPTIPPGWNFSPSDWTQRIPIIALAFVGLYISRYLAAFQLEHIDGVFEPFFSGSGPEKNGTEEIITSSVSRAWPVPDAGLGALTYMLEILTGLVGSRQRWRTMPWLVMLFGIMIVPLGAVSIFFIVIQPIVIGTWCTLCLVAAAAMVMQIPYSLDELVATTQFLIRRKRAGRSLLRVFFRGDTDEAQPLDEEVLEDEFDRPAMQVLRDSFGGGVNLPWNLCVCALIGIALMCTRLFPGSEPPLAHADHLLGALIVTVSVTALAEVARPLRAFNFLLGAAVIGAPWMLDGGGFTAIAVNGLLGLAVIGLSLRRGNIGNRYGNVSPYLV